LIFVARAKHIDAWGHFLCLLSRRNEYRLDDDSGKSN